MESQTERMNSHWRKSQALPLTISNYSPVSTCPGKAPTAGYAAITTFDLRMTRPNHEPVMNTAEIHAIEHLGATFLRNHRRVRLTAMIYFGPMGCRTGFYLLLVGDYESRDIIPLHAGNVRFHPGLQRAKCPALAPRDCGNYLDMNLPMANYLAKKYLENVLTDIPGRPSGIPGVTEPP